MVKDVSTAIAASSQQLHLPVALALASALSSAKEHVVSLFIVFWV